MGVTIPDGIASVILSAILLMGAGLTTWMIILLWKITLRLGNLQYRMRRVEARLGIEVVPMSEDTGTDDL